MPLPISACCLYTTYLCTLFPTDSAVQVNVYTYVPYIRPSLYRHTRKDALQIHMGPSAFSSLYLAGRSPVCNCPSLPCVKPLCLANKSILSIFSVSLDLSRDSLSLFLELPYLSLLDLLIYLPCIYLSVFLGSSYLSFLDLFLYFSICIWMSISGRLRMPV